VTMSTAPLTAPERDTLLERHRTARALYNQGMDAHAESLGMPAEIGIDESSSVYVDTPAYQQAREALAELKATEEEYFRRLPHLVMAPCPYCGEPLRRAFDPLGVDGLWWRSDAQPEEPQPCMHFCVLLGAVSLGSYRPRPDFDVHLGPGAPFVMPKLMAEPGMIAAVAEVPIVEGALAYAIAYFAARRPPVQTLTAPWARTNFVYTTQLGEHAWRRAEEPSGAPDDRTWDFALEPWLQAGRLRWCEPGTDRTKLSTAATAACPFVDLPGPRTPQVLRPG
jgi:hypothetical protein